MADNQYSFIKLKRQKAVALKHYAWTIVVDNVEVNSIQNDQEIILPINPGLHTIYIEERAVFTARSKLVQLNIQAGETINLVCFVNLSGWVGTLELYIDAPSHLPDQQPTIQPKISTSFLNETETRKAASEIINVPPGVIINVKRSRTLQHTVHIEWNHLGEAHLQVGWKEIISASVRGEIERRYTRDHQESETIEYEITLDGKVSSRYELVWIETWRKGWIETINQKSTTKLPFQFREKTELSVLAT
jgi:hypothetical protein